MVCLRHHCVNFALLSGIFFQLGCWELQAPINNSASASIELLAQVKPVPQVEPAAAPLDISEQTVDQVTTRCVQVFPKCEAGKFQRSPQQRRVVILINGRLGSNRAAPRTGTFGQVLLL